MYLTEQQRLEALRACEGIEAALAKQQQALKNIIEICDRMAARYSAVGDRDTRAASTTSA